MRLEFQVVDAFELGPFTGNPAAVCVLDSWLPVPLMQGLANEFNLSETAFLVGGAEGWELRWFTPTAEVDLCGHATLAAAHTLIETGREAVSTIAFSTRSGVLPVEQWGERAQMRLPAVRIASASVPSGLETALGAEVVAAANGGQTLVAELGSVTRVRELTPDFASLRRLKAKMICVTAEVTDADRAVDPLFRECDFVQRVFAPSIGINEDPATGSAQCALAPFWSRRLGRTELRSFQLSARGGLLYADCSGDGGVYVGGSCRTFARGQAELA